MAGRFEIAKSLEHYRRGSDLVVASNVVGHICFFMHRSITIAGIGLSAVSSPWTGGGPGPALGLYGPEAVHTGRDVISLLHSETVSWSDPTIY